MCSLNGDSLPLQVIYAGKSPRCLPSVSFPKSWHVTFTENHWANKRTTIDHITKILLPHVKEMRQKLSLSPDHMALVIYDRFKGQCTPTVLQLLSDNNIQIAIVSANITDRLQQLDISVNKAVKDCLRKQFSEWYSKQVCCSAQPQESSKEIAVPSGCGVDLSLSTLKQLGVKWLVSTYDHFKAHKNIVVNQELLQRAIASNIRINVTLIN